MCMYKFMILSGAQIKPSLLAQLVERGTVNLEVVGLFDPHTKRSFVLG